MSMLSHLTCSFRSVAVTVFLFLSCQTDPLWPNNDKMITKGDRKKPLKASRSQMDLMTNQDLLPLSLSSQYSLNLLGIYGKDLQKSSDMSSVGLMISLPRGKQTELGMSLSFEQQPGSNLVMGDPLIMYRYILPHLLFGIRWDLTFKVSLPVSEDSRENGLISRVSSDLSAGLQFLAYRLKVFLSPEFILQGNRYQSSKSHHGERNRPLPFIEYGIKSQIKYHMDSHFVIGGIIYYYLINYEEVVGSVYFIDFDQPKYRSFIEIDAGYPILSGTFLHIGVSRGNSFLGADRQHYRMTPEIVNRLTAKIFYWL